MTNKEILKEALEKVLDGRDFFYMGYCSNASDFSLVERTPDELAEELSNHLQAMDAARKDEAQQYAKWLFENGYTGDKDWIYDKGGDGFFYSTIYLRFLNRNK